MPKQQKNVAIIGAGSWGTALACMMARTYDHALLYTWESAQADEINTQHKNSKYLGDILLPYEVTATTDLAATINYDIIIIAVPSHAFEDILFDLKKINLSSKPLILIATKGLCSRPVQLFSSKIEQEFDNKYGFISGPNFAKEVALGNFASVTITSKNLPLAKKIANILRSDQLRTTYSSDIITMQIAGIVKNIIAIKSGIFIAEGYGENAKAWLVAQGLDEIATISQAMGGRAVSLTLPAVIGDLVLTSYSTTSRNTKFGYEFHKNNYSKEFLKSYPILVEGISGAKLLQKYLEDYNLYLPITSSIAKLVM